MLSDRLCIEPRTKTKQTGQNKNGSADGTKLNRIMKSRQ